MSTMSPALMKNSTIVYKATIALEMDTWWDLMILEMRMKSEKIARMAQMK